MGKYLRKAFYYVIFTGKKTSFRRSSSTENSRLLTNTVLGSFVLQKEKKKQIAKLYKGHVRIYDPKSTVHKYILKRLQKLVEARKKKKTVVKWFRTSDLLLPERVSLVGCFT